MPRAAGPDRRGGRWLAAGDRLPERDRVVVHEQWLIDLLADVDCRDVRAGQPPGDAQLFLHPRHAVCRPGDPNDDGCAGELEDRVLAEAHQLGAVAVQARSFARRPEYGESRGRREPFGGIRHGVQDSRPGGPRSRAPCGKGGLRVPGIGGKADGHHVWLVRSARVRVRLAEGAGSALRGEHAAVAVGVGRARGHL